jgi:BirA family biotin operon repressor/biotin-[acetyl-CoA-carboxylase] ligase
MCTAAAAVAVSEALEDEGVFGLQIKWVNDIYVKGRKAAGILTKAEFSSKDKTDYVIVGIGINLTVPKEGFHEEIKDIAGALRDEVSPDERDRLVGVFLRELLSYYKCMPEVTFSEEYRKRLLYVGEKITVREKESFYSATVIGVNERLQLEILTEDGKKKTLYTEEITIRQDDING